MDKVYKYYAFISYKHKDEKWAKWIQKALESYRLPIALQKQNCPKRLSPIFRDSTDLTPGNLEQRLYENLELSNYIIVICSRNLAKESHYVDYEIQSFIDMGRADRIIPLIVDGEPNSADPEKECFSEVIKNIPGELLAANVQKDGKRIAALKVIAAILRLNADDLIKRDRKRNTINRTLGVAGVVCATLILNTILNLTAMYYEKEAVNASLYNDTESSVENAIRSIRVPFRNDLSEEAEQILRKQVISRELKNSNSSFHKEFEINTQPVSSYLYAESLDNTKVGFHDFSRVFVYDAVSGRYITSLRTNSRYTEDIAEFKELFGFVPPESTPVPIIPEADGSVSAKYTEDISGDILSICDRSGKAVRTFSVDKDSGEWTYSQNDDMIAVYGREGERSITVYSFEHDTDITLFCPEICNAMSAMYFSPKGRYLFVNFNIRGSDGFFDGDYLCVYDLESGDTVYECREDRNLALSFWSFSERDDRQSIYVFSSNKIEKFSYTDREPELASRILYTIDENNVITAKNKLSFGEVHIGSDETKAVSIQNFYFADANKTLYNIFDINTGRSLKTLVTDMSGEPVDMSPDIRCVIYYLDGHVVIYDTDKARAVYDADCSDRIIDSVAISRDGKNAAYIDNRGVLTVLKESNGAYRESFADIPFNADLDRKILFISDDMCVFNSDGNIRSYELRSGQIKTIVDDVYTLHNVGSTDEFNVFKSYRNIESLGLICDTTMDGKIFYSMNGSTINMPEDLILFPNAYSHETELLAGMEYTNQMQYNTELVMVDLKTQDVLYRYTTGIDAKHLSFDNSGKYLIINGTGKSEVLEAATGKLMFMLDRNITVCNDTVYDVSADMLLPDVLPRARIGSLREFVKKGAEIIG